MRTHYPKYYLRSLTHIPLEDLGADEVDNTIQLLQSEELERKKERILTELSTLLKPQSPTHGTLDFKIPQTPICGSSVNRKHQGKHTKTPPRASTHKLINLSFSQPATPRTPFSSVDKCVSATPMHPTQTYQPYYSSEGFVPCTPIVNNPMQVLCVQTSSNTHGFDQSFPDILEMIDNDSNSVSLLDKHIHAFTDVELNDDTVIEYLLDISREFEKPTMIKEAPKRCFDESLMHKRKCRRAKPVSMEEAESLKRLQKERSKDKAKQRQKLFKNKSRGKRKSQRNLRRVKYSF
ncbi:hypothetical protein ScPMuIL_014783 [Solemya velum]